jgi:hypothetical protein
MAIYKNREVTVVGPNSMANSPDTINVAYKDNTHENVATAMVSFTETEKKDLVKKHPSKFNDVTVISLEDVESVRAGIAPKKSTPKPPWVK